MRMEHRPFQFEILVIEDEPKWLDPMKEALSRVLGSENQRYRWDFAHDAVEARRRLTEKRYHFVSIDQNLPERTGEQVLPETGKGLWELLAEQHRLSLRIVYTAYGEPHFAYGAATTGHAQYWQKSATGRDDEERHIFSSDGWANKINEILDREYLGSALFEAGRFLPLEMAELARRIASQTGSDQNVGFQPLPGRELNYLKHTFDLWEATLHLAWAQGVALGQRAASRVVTAPAESAASREKGLERLFGELGERGWLGPWSPYIGKGNTKTGKGAGRRFLEGASVPLRGLRNLFGYVCITCWSCLERC